MHTDYQGSWLAITNSSGTVTNRYSYDAWGRPRNVADWLLKPVTISNLISMQPRFDRGYTGHEMICGFGLINMNGRLYDPYLQRFLSPDPMVQAPGNAQSYNRYSYCMNNPLMYTDPSGYNWKSLFGCSTGYIKGTNNGVNWSKNKSLIYTAAFAAIIVGSCILTGGAGAVFLGAWMNVCANMYSPNNN